MQIRRTTLSLISLLLLVGGILWFRHSLEAAGKPNAGPALSELAHQVSSEQALAEPGQKLPLNAGSVAPSVAVSNRNGFLSIVARRAALHDVLVAVTQATGVTFSAGDDTGYAVTLAIGPAPLQQAIVDLIQQLGYGYALMGSDLKTRSSGPAHVFLLRQAHGVHSSRAFGWASNAPTQGDPGSPQSNDGGPAAMDAATALQHRVFEQIMAACRQQECDSS